MKILKKGTVQYVKYSNFSLVDFFSAQHKQNKPTNYGFISMNTPISIYPTPFSLANKQTTAAVACSYSIHMYLINI